MKTIMRRGLCSGKIAYPKSEENGHALTRAAGGRRTYSRDFPKLPCQRNLQSSWFLNVKLRPMPPNLDFGNKSTVAVYLLRSHWQVATLNSCAQGNSGLTAIFYRWYLRVNSDGFLKCLRDQLAWFLPWNWRPKAGTDRWLVLRRGEVEAVNNGKVEFLERSVKSRCSGRCGGEK